MKRAPSISRLRVAGYRSLGDIELSLAPLNVLIGANGAGKSNVLDVLRLLDALRRGALRPFVGRAGGAATLLYRGRTRSTGVELSLTYEVGPVANADPACDLTMRLVPTDDDGLMIEREALTFDREHPSGTAGGARGERESLLLDDSDPSMAIVGPPATRIYHFHDTARDAPLRTHARRGDDARLRADGGNLAAFLLRLSGGRSEPERVAWRTILRKVREVAPQVHRLTPTVAGGGVRLDWEDAHGNVFGCHQLSDGTLRAVALLTTLYQPFDDRPDLMAFDEPELGLHPAALATVAGALRVASVETQILVATQSPALLDEVPVEQVVVCDFGEDGTALRRLDPDALRDWLADYTLSDLWHMNVLGGRP